MKSLKPIVFFVVLASCTAERKTAYSESVSGCIVGAKVDTVRISVAGISVDGGQKKVNVDSVGCFQSRMFSYGIGSEDLPNAPELMGKIFAIELSDASGWKFDTTLNAISFQYLRKNEAVVRLPVIKLSP